MRANLVHWLHGHGLPGWLAPGYAMTVALAGIVGISLWLRLARHDRTDERLEARALAIGYLAALLGGYLIEWIRAVPEALSAASLVPLGSKGRAAYGGLVFGALAAALWVRQGGGLVRPFLDRLTVVLGSCYLFVRTGCFLAGCDYGLPTASPLGLRFPAGSAAATDHAAHGWVAIGAPSLPVHPTQLYEAALGLGASLAAGYWLWRGHRDGRAIASWLGVYALGRFALEGLRGDSTRGLYAGLSSAQLTSLALVTLLVVAVWRQRRVALAVAIAALCLALPAVVRAEDAQREGNTRHVGLRGEVGLGVPIGRAQLDPTALLDFAALARIPFSDRHRFEVGAELEGELGEVANHVEVGIPLELCFGVSEHFEILLSLTPRYTRVIFESDYFEDENAYGGRFDIGLAVPITSRLSLGVAPLSNSLLTSPTIDPIYSYDPRLWVEVGL